MQFLSDTILTKLSSLPKSKHNQEKRKEKKKKKMVSLETVQATSRSIEPTSSPRISFSAEFLDDTNFISISPNSHPAATEESDQKARTAAEFEFLSSNLSSHNMITADELFFEGKLLPFWQMQHAEKLNKVSLKMKGSEAEEEEDIGKEESTNSSRVSWFVDDDPSPRPPKCTVLCKELLRLKKQRALTLSPSSSSSSSSSSSASSFSANLLADIASAADEGNNKEGLRHMDKQQHVKGVRKGLERTRSATIRIRPMISVPICTQVKSSSALPPLFPLKKGKLER